MAVVAAWARLEAACAQLSSAKAAPCSKILPTPDLVNRTLAQEDGGRLPTPILPLV